MCSELPSGASRLTGRCFFAGGGVDGYSSLTRSRSGWIEVFEVSETPFDSVPLILRSSGVVDDPAVSFSDSLRGVVGGNGGSATKSANTFFFEILEDFLVASLGVAGVAFDGGSILAGIVGFRSIGRGSMDLLELLARHIATLLANSFRSTTISGE